MTQRERDVLKVMSLVLKGQRTQAEAARLLKLCVRQVCRIAVRLKKEGDGAVVHQLRGRPSNRRIDQAVKKQALSLYRKKYPGFGPTLAAEKLAELDQVKVAVRTLREWLLAEGLWTRQRRRDRHRSRRMRKACFGEMIQADASLHDWLEGRANGLRLTLVGMIDDATGKMLCRFYPAETTAAYMDLLWRWIAKHGRPVAWYSDKHSIFQAQSKLLGEEEPVLVPTQFSRALQELEIELIPAHSPQAKGRIERLWGTAQDRLVKELRLAKARTLEEANAVVDKVFVPWFNRRCTVAAADMNDAHRALGKGVDLAVILCIQEKRRVFNDYTIRLDNSFIQLLPPVWPGQRKGEVTVEKRLDGSMKIRFKEHYLEYRRIEAQIAEQGLAAPGGDELSLAQQPIPAECLKKEGASKAKDPPCVKSGSSAVHRPAKRSGRTPAEPYPFGGKSCGSGKQSWRPASNHPWRNAG